MSLPPVMPAGLARFNKERSKRLDVQEMREANSLVDRAKIRAKRIIKQADQEAKNKLIEAQETLEQAKSEARSIILKAERAATLVTEKAYNLGLAKADLQVRANDRRRATLQRKKSTS